MLSQVGRFGNVLNLGVKRPIIMVGTGRCGTTLVDKILKSHSGIAKYPGEANELWHPKLEPHNKAQINSPPIEVDPKKYTELSIANWPNNQDNVIQRTFTGFHLVSGKSKVFFVKSAMISFMIPKILSIFPDARFLHVYRFGPSVVESYFKKNFGKDERYSFTEEEYYRICARYWNSCILEIERVKNELALEVNDAFYEFSYESLCENPSGILAELADFMSVDYNQFEFDLSTIKSTNYKVSNKSGNEKIREIVDAELSVAMKLKNYLT